MGKKVLIIVDMLNGFCRKGYPLSLPDSTANIERYITSRILEIFKEGGQVIFICDSHSLTDPEIGNPYPPHCLKGTKEAEIIDELKSLAQQSIIITKNTLSVFFNTNLENILKELSPIEIEVSGLCTDICDLFAVYELRIRGYSVFVSNKGVLPLNSTGQKEFLDYFRDKLGAKIEY